MAETLTCRGEKWLNSFKADRSHDGMHQPASGQHQAEILHLPSTSGTQPETSAKNLHNPAGSEVS